MLKVLLVEDEYIVRQGMESMVEWGKNGFMLLPSVSNGKEALELLKNESVDIVVTDVKMPVMDGLTLCQEIRKENLDCEIVIISSYDDFSYAKQALKLGVSDYLYKPALNPSNIMEALTNVSDKRRRAKILRQQLLTLNSSYEEIRKSALRKIFVKGERDLFDLLKENNRAKEDLVETILVYISNDDITISPLSTMQNIARNIYKLQQSDEQIMSVPIDENIIAVFYFPDKKTFFKSNISEKLHLGPFQCKCYQSVFLPDLPDAIVRYRELFFEEIKEMSFNSGSSQSINKAISYIHENYAGRISLVDVANFVNLTPSYLSRLLSHEYGKKFIDILTELRIEKAKKLLDESNYDIEHITGLVGYQNSKYFIKTFKRSVGTTPGQYRKTLKFKKSNSYIKYET